MPNERGSEYSPTFVYRREKKKKPDDGKTKVREPKMPLATDLHIVFTQGGVTVTNKDNAEKVDRETTRGNVVHLTFPPSKKIKAGDGVDPPPAPKDGQDAPEAPESPPESSSKPTFRHSKPDFPPIKEWWWTHTRWNKKKKRWENYEGTHHKGNPTGWEHE